MCVEKNSYFLNGYFMLECTHPCRTLELGIKMPMLNEPDLCGVAASHLSDSGVFVSSDRQILSVDRRHHLRKKTIRSVLPVRL